MLDWVCDAVVEAVTKGEAACLAINTFDALVEGCVWKRVAASDSKGWLRSGSNSHSAAETGQLEP